MDAFCVLDREWDEDIDKAVRFFLLMFRTRSLLCILNGWDCREQSERLSMYYGYLFSYLWVSGQDVQRAVERYVLVECEAHLQVNYGSYGRWYVRICEERFELKCGV